MHQSGTVYIWYPHGSQVGHAAMHIGSDIDPDTIDTYVSWWPQAETKSMMGEDVEKLFGASSDKKTHNDDIAGEDGPPHLIYKIYGGDISKMQTAWISTRNKPNSHYDLFRKSCSTIVARILKAGGHHHFMSTAQRLIFTNNMIWTPKNVAQFCNQLRDNRYATKIRDKDCPDKADAETLMRLFSMR
ncbi:MAG: hypothetical protein AAFY59_03445 [Pseudomonadota bacterium]